MGVVFVLGLGPPHPWYFIFSSRLSSVLPKIPRNIPKMPTISPKPLSKTSSAPPEPPTITAQNSAAHNRRPKSLQIARIPEETPKIPRNILELLGIPKICFPRPSFPYKSQPEASARHRGGAYRGVNPGGTPGLPKTPSLGTRGSLYHCNPRFRGVFSAKTPNLERNVPGGTFYMAVSQRHCTGTRMPTDANRPMLTCLRKRNAKFTSKCHALTSARAATCRE